MTVQAAQATTAASAMIIPNKSTMEEEYIEVPYGRDARESSTTIDGDASRSQEGAVLADGDLDSASDYPSPNSLRGPGTGLNGLTARLKGVEDEEDISKSGEDYYDKISFGRTSAASDRSATGITSRLNGRASVTEDQEKMRRDYEYKIATMQAQITNLQRDLGDAEQKDRKFQDAEFKVKQMEEELQGLRRVSRGAAFLNKYDFTDDSSVLKSRLLLCVPCKKN